MATTADYLNKLVVQKNALADNLTTKGVIATHDETLETLVPKVLDISGGGTSGNGIHPIGEDGRPTGDVIVPEGVTSLYRYIFDSDTNITSVNLPTTLTSLSAYAFNGCTALADIALNDNISAVPDNCFRTTGITEFTMPRALSKIGVSAFGDCSSLQNVNFKKSDNVAYINIKNYAFDNCTNLTNINFETDDIVIFPSHYGFSRCSSLDNNEVMKIIDHLYSNAYTIGCFNGCIGITDIITSKSGEYMFRGCTNLVHCKVLESVTYMYAGMFAECTSLVSIELPATINSVTTYALTQNITYSSYFLCKCTNLETVSVGEGWNMSMRLDVTTKLTVDSMVGIFNNLKDLTGETAKTLTLGSTNLAKLTDEQKAIAINKNWTLA